MTKLENQLADHRRGSVPTKGLALQNYKEKEAYLQFEVSDGSAQCRHAGIILLKIHFQQIFNPLTSFFLSHIYKHLAEAI